MEKAILLIFCSLLLIRTNAQMSSIHAEQSKQFGQYKMVKESDWDARWKMDRSKLISINSKHRLRKIVFGWQPYWMGTSYKNYDYSLLSDVAYFSYEVNPETGSYTDIHYWRTTELPAYVHHVGKRVHLTATLFANHAVLLENPNAVQTLIDSLISLVKYRDADGVNIDFEMLKSAQRDNFTAFIVKLANALHNYKASAMLSMALPAVDWSKSFDVIAMQPYVDLYLIMGYEYHWSRSDYAGPVAPKNNGEIWPAIDATRSVEYYLQLGVDKDKLALAVPYYGREWQVESSGIPAKTVAKGKSYTYAQITDTLKNVERLWDWNAANAYYNRHTTDGIFQMWYDDALSLGYKYDMTKTLDIAGIAIWALGYDGDRMDLWNEIAQKFSMEADTALQNYIWDLGGAKGNYADNESYTLRIAHPEAESLSLLFDTFSVEQDFDTLFIYRGEAKKQNLVANFTGTLNLDSLYFKPADFSLHFKSDGRTNAAGWQAHWKLKISQLPYTLLDFQPWYTKDFTLNFEDKVQNAKILQAFYQLPKVDNSCHSGFGYFYDNFSSNSRWKNTGTWLFAQGLFYTETSLSSLIYTDFQSKENNAYFYSFRADLSQNSILSFYFMVDSLLNNEPVSGFRLSLMSAKDSICIYQLSNQSQNLLAGVVHQFTDTALDIGLAYLPAQDSLLVYRDGKIVLQIANIQRSRGKYLGFEAQDRVSVQELAVYKARNNQLTLKIGNNNEIQNENQDAGQAAYQLINVLIDSKYRLSQYQHYYLNIDSSPPKEIASVLDGLVTDIDEFDTPDKISAHWTSSADSQSGIRDYWFSIGTSAGKTDVLNWANLGMATKVSVYNLNLERGKTYYFNLKAENKAGLFSNIKSSKGQFLNNISGINRANEVKKLLEVYPNPFSTTIHGEWNFNPLETYTYSLIDANGRLILTGRSKQKRLNLDLDAYKLVAGIYFLQISYQGRGEVYKIITNYK